MNKKITIIICVIIFAIVAIAIGTTLKGEGKETPREKLFIVGLDDSFPPFGYRDENNEIVGLDIDLAREVAKELGKEVRFQPISWASKEQEIDSGNIDCIWNGFAYSKERAETMTLSAKYIKGQMYFITRGDSKNKTQEELEGLTIGVQSGSVQEADLEKSEFGKKCKIVAFEDFLTACMDLENGGLDAVYCSSTYGNYIIKTKNKDYNTIASTGITNASGSVVAFKLGNTELRDEVNEALKKMEEDGRLEEISIKWFGENMLSIEE